MPDFSHYKRPPLSSYIRSIERGFELPGEAFALALDEIRPPLLDPAELAALKYQLEPCFEGKRGAPKSGLSRAELAEKVRGTRRPDVPKPFTDALARHLEVPREQPKEVLRKLRSAFNKRRLSDRDLLIRHLYSVFYELADGSGPWSHERFGIIEPLPVQPTTRGERAVRLTQRWLFERELRPPSERTMLNIVARKR